MIQSIMQKKMNRKEFITYFGTIILAVVFLPKGINKIFESETENKINKHIRIIE